jgi:hypothetical protein
VGILEWTESVGLSGWAGKWEGQAIGVDRKVGNMGKTCHFPTFLAKLAKSYKRLNFQHESKNVSSSVYQHALKPNYLFPHFLVLS